MKMHARPFHFGERLLHRQGSLVLWLIQAVFSIVMSLFFRRIELVNSNLIPKDKGLVFVMNHPNGLIDAALVFVALPRKVSFLAKSTIFKMPVLGFLAKAVEALPVYRQSDAKEDMAKNQETFRRCRELLKKSGAIAIFPEGVSHNETKLQPLKTGAARIALGAVSVGENPNAVDLHVVPVGLYYTNKTDFRSEAMLIFGESFPVLPAALNDLGEPLREDVKSLTQKIEDALLQVTINAENENELESAHIAQELFASVYETNDPAQTLADKFEFLRSYVTDSALDKTENERSENFEKRLADYDRKLEKLGIEPENLALPQYSFGAAAKYFFKRFWFLVIFSPLAIIGAILHFPAYQVGKLLAYIYARNESRDIASTVKVLAGMVLMPLTWIILAVILYFYFGWKLAVASIPLSFLCGYVALRTLEEIDEMRGWIKAAWLFLSGREKFLRLLAERRRLYETVKNKK
ncbi:MAG: 1-acyl-sn-glycerol-3-phosphate acyltransferase [Pyrinomonadaceae bacterium]|nr:1-acyl-sn-glycerol-3-phosphate acyltransferase [Pyrinomonadaceae bacterium]